jgi:hypothetical protein
LSSEGDDNTKKIHRFSNYRKNIKFVWKIAKEDGSWAMTFPKITFERVNYLKTLFKDDS